MANQRVVNGNLLLMLLLLAGLIVGGDGLPHPKTTPTPGTGHPNSAPGWVEPFLWVVVSLASVGMLGLVGWFLSGCCSKDSAQNPGETTKLVNGQGSGDTSSSK